MRLPESFKSKWIAPIILIFCLVSGFGSSLDDLKATPELTPEKFATLFTNYEFKYLNVVQSPEKFLATRSGDCDDFSIMAGTVLGSKGYHSRLIAIRMPNVVHVVCYVEESKGYLDYNLRQKSALVPCSPEIARIAESVAHWYGLPWSSASEFYWDPNARTGQGIGAKRLVKTVVPPTTHNGIFATILK